ncbi:hypothetical protein ACFX1W_024753 [Malus domestica]
MQKWKLDAPETYQVKRPLSIQFKLGRPGYEENIAENVDANGEKSTNSSKGNNDLEEEWDHKALANIEKNLVAMRVWDHDFLGPE